MINEKEPYIMFTVTLKDLRTNRACFDGYNRVVRMLKEQPFSEEDKDRRSYIHFDHDEPISLADICKNNGIDDAMWATRCLDSTHDRDLRLFGVWCVRRIQHLLTDPRSLKAIDVSEKFANGLATQEELEEARKGAWDAPCITYADAAYYAADAAYYAADAAYYAADAADDYDYEADRLIQAEMFIQICNGQAPW